MKLTYSIIIRGFSLTSLHIYDVLEGSLVLQLKPRFLLGGVLSLVWDRSLSGSGLIKKRVSVIFFTYFLSVGIM